MATKPHILDVTLRDGSYEVNFSFTVDDTRTLCRRLEQAGVRYIEVGHGVGLNASAAGYGQAVHTDEEYLEAAQGAVSKATFGMFCIPGIARLQDIDLAHRYAMGFIRIGTNVTEVRQSEEFIRRAKRYGMFVAANYMKSYALAPDEFAAQVRLSIEYGADMVYIVDSSGGMFPEDVERYYRAIRRVSSQIPVGFHGHDNLGMAVANSLAAIDMGIEFVDASLQGLGRSAGNTCSEILVAALQKRGIARDLNLLELLDMGIEHVQPLLTAKGHMPLDVIAGLADFHSSYMPHIQKASAKHGVDPRILIVAITQIDKVNLDPQVLDQIARDLKAREPRGPVHLRKYAFNRYIGGEQEKKGDDTR